MATTICKNCFATIPKDAKFCAECGAPNEDKPRERRPATGKDGAKAGKDSAKGDKDAPKEPTAEDLKKYGPSGFKPGTFVEIFGLESGDGKKMNGLKGRITKYIYEKIRYEVSLGQKKVSIRPINLKVTEKPDKKWTYGNTCRVVAVHDEEDEVLRDASGCLGTLMSRNVGGAWSAIANGKIHSVNPEHLRVCTDDEEYSSFSRPSQIFLSLTVVVTFHILLAAGIVVMKLSLPGLFNVEYDDGFEQAEKPFLSKVLNPTIPSEYVAGLSATTAVWSFLVLWGMIFICCRMHRCIWDPLTTFPQIAELSVGRRSAKVVYRLGFGMVALLLLATMGLHKQIVMPHLPVMESVKDDVFFWGLAGVAGIAVQAVVLVEPSYGWHTLAQRAGGALIIWAVYKHMSLTLGLYMPGVQTSPQAWFQLLKEYVADGHEMTLSEEEQANAQILQNAKEFAASSKFLHTPALQIAIIVRYNVLSYWPSACLMLPVFSSILEKLPDNSKVSGSSLLRSLFAWFQWFLVLVCSLMHLSYIPDLVIASLMPVPMLSEDGP